MEMGCRGWDRTAHARVGEACACYAQSPWSWSRHTLARTLTDPRRVVFADMADPPSTTPTTTCDNSELAGVDARDEDDLGPLASEEVTPRPAGDLLVSRSSDRAEQGNRP